jgi:hypothetical protein
MLRINVYALSISVLALAGCSPSVIYKHMNQPTSSSTVDASAGHAPASSTSKSVVQTIEPTDPAKDEVVFALRSSSIVLSSPSAVKQSNAQPLYGQNTQQLSRADTSGTTGPKIVDCGSAGQAEQMWRDCINLVSVDTVPTAHISDIYVVHQLHGVSIKITPEKDLPLLPASLTENYSNPETATITSVGTNAAAGYTLGGPVGAIVVAGTGLAEQYFVRDDRVALYVKNEDLVKLLKALPKSVAQQATISRPPWPPKVAKLCLDQDIEKPSADKLPNKPSLYLPVSLDHTIPEAFPCWHAFPQGDDAYTNWGWFYRVIDRPADLTGEFPPVYGIPGDNRKFYANTKGDLNLTPSLDHAYWPASAARAVTLEIIWWSKLSTSPNDPAADAMKRYKLNIADPTNIQWIGLTKSGRTITFLKDGGAYAVNNNTPASADLTGTSGKELLAIQAAQAQYVKAHAAAATSTPAAAGKKSTGGGN